MLNKHISVLSYKNNLEIPYMYFPKWIPPSNIVDNTGFHQSTWTNGLKHKISLSSWVFTLIKVLSLGKGKLLFFFFTKSTQQRLKRQWYHKEHSIHTTVPKTKEYEETNDLKILVLSMLKSWLMLLGFLRKPFEKSRLLKTTKLT